jgi:hypothetical protein
VSRREYLPTDGQVETALDTAADSRAQRLARLEPEQESQPPATQNMLPVLAAIASGPSASRIQAEPHAPPSAWSVGDSALYQRAEGSERSVVKVVRVDAGLPGDIPSIIVQMPDGRERDTTPARLSPAAAATTATEREPPQPALVERLAELEYGYEWQIVPSGSSVPPNMQYTLPLEGQPRQARIAPEWQLQLWSEPAGAFYRLYVRRYANHADSRSFHALNGVQMVIVWLFLPSGRRA